MKSLLCCCFALVAVSAPAEELRVMSFNLWHGGDAGRQPLEQTAQVIRAAKADVVGLQEIAGFAPKEPKNAPRPDHGAKLAALLGWNYQCQNPNSTAVISRHPIVGPLASRSAKHGALIKTPAGREVALFNVHLAHAPYQPYQLLSIPYVNSPPLKTAEEAIESAKKARGEQLRDLLVVIEKSKAATQIVTGDFNEPSGLDWTPAAVEAKLCPHVVDWPTTKGLMDIGFVDSFRKLHPDPVKRPGITWTPITKPDDPKDHHDRIDFVFVRGAAKIEAVQIVGEAAERADIVVTPYPSDHRAVVMTVTLE